MVSSAIIPVFSLVAFAAIHSLMASLPFKRLLVRVLGSRVDRLYMSVFSLIAKLTILPLVYLLYKNPGPVLYIIPSPWSWLMVGGQLIAAIVASRTFLDALHRFKIRLQLSAPEAPEAGLLNIRGIYRWIKDPFLLSGMVIIWLTPFMTVSLLVIYLFSFKMLHFNSKIALQQERTTLI